MSRIKDEEDANPAATVLFLERLLREKGDAMAPEVRTEHAARLLSARGQLAARKDKNKTP